LEDQPAQGWFFPWILGAALPLGIFAYGVCATITRRATFFGSQSTMPVTGTNATALGIAAISLAIFLHCHYFWGNIYDQAWPAVLGKIVSACGFIAGLGTLIVRVGLLGIS
jgi:hypothetical protein